MEQFPRMKVTCLAAILAMAAPVAAQNTAARGASTAAPSKIAQAYEQFALGHRLEQSDDAAGAIAAYKRAMELDPSAAEIPAQLASVYWRQDREADAIATAEQALKIDGDNAEANRILGMI